MLLANLGNIDWRALINLWSVLEYLTKYCSKPGKGAKTVNEVFGEVLAAVNEYEVEDGVHDLWRRTIMKFYSRILGDRDYSLFEVMHFGLQLPHTISSFRDTVNVSVSSWVPLKSNFECSRAKGDDRVTHLSKVQIFNQRCELQKAEHVPLLKK